MREPRTRVPRLGLLHISGLTHFTAPPRGAHSPTDLPNFYSHREVSSIRKTDFLRQRVFLATPETENRLIPMFPRSFSHRHSGRGKQMGMPGIVNNMIGDPL